jgi:hypothetical protein
MALKERFAAEVKPLLERGDTAGLEDLYSRWSHGMEVIENKEREFNVFDSLDPMTRNQHGGMLWTARMLEYCREGGELRFIDAGQQDLDFALLAMELTLGIGKRRNRFTPNTEDYIIHDGLGIRRGKTFCVIECKVNERTDLLDPTLQALCGALAIYVKRDMIEGLARHHNGRRPAVSRPSVSTGSPSIGLYMLIHHERYDWDGEAGLLRSLGLIRGAFPFVREIAYFAVQPEEGFPARIPADQVIRDSE